MVRLLGGIRCNCVLWKLPPAEREQVSEESDGTLPGGDLGGIRLGIRDDSRPDTDPAKIPVLPSIAAFPADRALEAPPLRAACGRPLNALVGANHGAHVTGPHNPGESGQRRGVLPHGAARPTHTNPRSAGIRLGIRDEPRPRCRRQLDLGWACRRGHTGPRDSGTIVS